jgi:starvation-inducible DNA-binding protein
MDELKIATKVVLANKFALYFKAHSYHWNVEGMFFSQLHDFFGDIYEEIHGSVDAAAEELRTLQEYAPISIQELYKYKTIDEDEQKPESAKEMLQNLLLDNTKVIESLNKLFDVATAQKAQGLADWAAGRIDTHFKHEWMIRSYLKD